MFVRAIARIDHGDVQMAGDEVRSPGSSVAHNQAVRLYCIQRVDRVEGGFSFFEAGGFGLEVHRVRAEPGGGRPKADARARGVFEKGQRNSFSAQGRQLFQRVPLNFLEWLALVEKEGEFVRGERFESEQVAEAVSQCPFSDRK